MAEPILSVETVSKAFGGLLAVCDVSFSMQPGEIVGLIGPNGAGKTTLFNVISGYYAPTRGRVVFQGKDVSGKPPYALAARGIGWVACWFDEQWQPAILLPDGRGYTPWGSFAIRQLGKK